MRQAEKFQAARDAVDTLETLRRAAARAEREGRGDEMRAIWRRHAEAASFLIQTVRAYDDSMLPLWLTQNWSYFEAFGWREWPAP
jgi:hypothetical protein